MICNIPKEVMTSRRCPYSQAYWDECEVIEPLGKQLLPKTKVTMQFNSPHLRRMMINKTMLEKTGDIFEGTALTPESCEIVTVYGSRIDSGSLKGQFKFCVA